MPKKIETILPSPEVVMAKLKKDREVHWYALRVSSQHERKLVAMLNERKINAFVPLRQEKHRWSDRMKVVEQVLTPGIIFARISMDRKTEVFVTRDVKSYVHNPGNSQPALISDESMQDFMRLIESNYNFKLTMPMVGDEVMVLDGQMRGVVGQLVRIDGEDQFVITLNEAFGATVKLDAISVAKVPKGTKSIPYEQVPNKV